MAEAVEKLENCEVCASNPAKYTCPKCEVRTCCLACINIHKKELNCDGIRDKTKFVPRDSFTDLDLLSDYRLLEDVNRSVDQLQRDPSKKFSRMNKLPPHLSKLRSAAFSSGVTLDFMPHNFTRHKENTSFVNWKTNELFWRIEWIFPQADNIKTTTNRALESTRLSDLLEEIINPLNSVKTTEITEINRLKLLHDKLQYYRAAGTSGFKVFLKAEGVKNAKSRFYELDLTETVKENLSRKFIIEFPTFHVVLNHHRDMYELIDSDEETELGDNSVRNLSFRNRQLNLKIPKKNPNFFFCDSDISDDEMELNNCPKNPKSQLEIPEYNELVKMNY